MSKIGDEIISYTGYSTSAPAKLTGCVRGVLDTTASTHSKDDVVQCYQLNGIPLQQLNKTHTITAVINMDEYQVTTTTKASSNLQSGGDKVLGSRNIAYQSIDQNLNPLFL